MDRNYPPWDGYALLSRHVGLGINKGATLRCLGAGGAHFNLELARQKSPAPVRPPEKWPSLLTAINATGPIFYFELPLWLRTKSMHFVTSGTLFSQLCSYSIEMLPSKFC